MSIGMRVGAQVCAENQKLSSKSFSSGVEGKFQGIHTQIQKVTKELQNMKQLRSGDGTIDKEEMRNKMNDLMQSEETFQMQRAGVNWLRGERNTIFFFTPKPLKEGQIVLEDQKMKMVHGKKEKQKCKKCQ